MSFEVESTTPSVLVSGSSTITFDEVDGATNGQVKVTFDGGGAVLSTGAQKVYCSVPYDGTITAARLVADQSGDIVIDIWKDTYANFPPTVADTITAAAKPTLSSAQKSEDTTLTGWTTSITKGDYLEFNIDSAATVTKVVCTLDIDKTGG